MKPPFQMSKLTTLYRGQLTRECATTRCAGLALLCIALFTIAAFTGMDLARADTEYYRHTFFDNSITSDAYFYSSGKVSTPSSLLLKDGKLPVDTKIFFTPPNGLRLEWQSTKGGGWDAEIRVVNFRNREINFPGDTRATRFICGASRRKRLLHKTCR